jgi:phosphoglycerol transferase MdoB-like AlkP superfamily enzyme
VSGQLTNSSRSSYLDNLALTDHAFGDLRRAMEASGVWDRSTVIVTADHWWRSDFWATGADWTTEEQQVAGRHPPDQRVPFMVKFPQGDNSLVYDRPFNTVITRQVIMAILTGQLRSGAELARWLNTHAVGTVNPTWNTRKEK